jgi:hypothetical protein
MTVDLDNPRDAAQRQTVRALASNLAQFPGNAIMNRSNPVHAASLCYVDDSSSGMRDESARANGFLAAGRAIHEKTHNCRKCNAGCLLPI